MWCYDCWIRVLGSEAGSVCRAPPIMTVIQDLTEDRETHVPITAYLQALSFSFFSHLIICSVFLLYQYPSFWKNNLLHFIFRCYFVIIFPKCNILGILFQIVQKHTPTFINLVNNASPSSVDLSCWSNWTSLLLPSLACRMHAGFRLTCGSNRWPWE